MMEFKIYTNGGGGWGGEAGGLVGAGRWRVDFFDILIYYFINIIIKTLFISSFIVVYVIHFTHSQYCCVLICFSLLLKNYTLAARNVSYPTVLEKDG